MSQMQKIAKANTSISTVAGITTVRLYSTDIVVIDANKGTVTLNAGGYRTKTTRDRMNQAANELGLGYRIFQRKFDWFVGTSSRVVDFYDGITVEL